MTQDPLWTRFDAARETLRKDADRGFGLLLDLFVEALDTPRHDFVDAIEIEVHDAARPSFLDRIEARRAGVTDPGVARRLDALADVVRKGIARRQARS